MQINTIYQLLAMKLDRGDVLAQAKKLIMIADLVSYFLCGRMYAEYSLASTSQLMDMRTGQWSKKAIAPLLPVKMPKMTRKNKSHGLINRFPTQSFSICERVQRS